MGFHKKKAVSKPYEVRYVRITLHNVMDVAKWCGGYGRVVTVVTSKKMQKEPRLDLDGVKYRQGDYIFQYPDGTFDGLPFNEFSEFYEKLV